MLQSRFELFVICEADRVLNRINDYPGGLTVFLQRVCVQCVVAVHVLEYENFADLLHTFKDILIGKTVCVSSADLLALKTVAFIPAFTQRGLHFMLNAVGNGTWAGDHGSDHPGAVPEDCDDHVPLFVFDSPPVGVVVQKDLLEAFSVHFLETIGIGQQYFVVDDRFNHVYPLSKRLAMSRGMDFAKAVSPTRSCEVCCALIASLVTKYLVSE